MSRGRAPEDEQIEMFHLIESQLSAIGIEKYEISNFAKPGFESQHNLVYWKDQSFWGLGVSAHSYDHLSGPFGERFWNTKDIFKYGEQSTARVLPAEQWEVLLKHEAMTDYCHMFLRTRSGLSEAALRNKFDAVSAQLIAEELTALLSDGLLERFGACVRLTTRGELLSNQVFERLTFLPPRTPLTQAKSIPYLTHV